MKGEPCFVCGKPLPSEGALRKVKVTGRIVPVHFECKKDRRLVGVFA
jgi:hypothetical protein